MQLCCSCYRMPDIPICSCCFCDIRSPVTISCDGAISHIFCSECVCRYMRSLVVDGNLKFSCMLHRACTGWILREDITVFLEHIETLLVSERSMLEDSSDSTTGNIVNCFNCSKSIRKLACYNYVACGCGTIACYGCGEDITHTVNRHSCSPYIKAKEKCPSRDEKTTQTGPTTSRRYQASSQLNNSQRDTRVHPETYVSSSEARQPQARYYGTTRYTNYSTRRGNYGYSW